MTAESPQGIVTCQRRQRTLGRAVAYAGIGLHTGALVQMRLLPAEAGVGVVIRRMDLPGLPTLPVHITAVGETSDRCTAVGEGRLRVYTVEHLMAALYANQIDNVYVELSSIEPPIANGSSDVFVDMLRDAGAVEQELLRPTLELHQPLYWSSGDTHIVALPHPHYRISYTVSYPACPVLRAQYRSCAIDAATFNRELAPCRTFCHYDEINALMDRGLIKGGSLDNAVIVKGEAVLSKNGLFFPDEMVRHKILDMVGDLALVGCDLQMHLIAIRASHAANCKMAELLHHTLVSLSPCLC